MTVANDLWIDLLDPTREQVEQCLPVEVHDQVLERLCVSAAHDDDPRPKFESHGDYVYGVILVAVDVPDEDLVYYQEVDLVLTAHRLITIRKTPVGGRPAYEPALAIASCQANEGVAMVLYHLMDDVAERFLDLIDALNDEIDELEDAIDEWSAERVRNRISELRHDLLHVRRVLAPLRDAVRQVVDGRIGLTDAAEVFTHEIQLNYAAAYDKLLRSTDGLELARDLIASARDFHQAKVANDQNEVMKKFTVITSTILIPTFIVGLYGQNFTLIPELKWHYGYAYSWALMVVCTTVQLAIYKKRGWL
jgi:magnesium transporter